VTDAYGGLLVVTLSLSRGFADGYLKVKASFDQALRRGPAVFRLETGIAMRY
jgi:hypothetical protein